MGRGALGPVYRSINSETGEFVAVKQLQLGDDSDEAVRVGRTSWHARAVSAGRSVGADS